MSVPEPALREHGSVRKRFAANRVTGRAKAPLPPTYGIALCTKFCERARNGR